MQINESLILQCLNELNKNYVSKKIYKYYYEGNHNILKNYTMQDSSGQSETFGESYELNYINEEGEFSETILNPLNCFVLEDGTAERNAIIAIHKFSPTI